MNKLETTYSNKQYLPSLDFLRALAALSVCFYHFVYGRRTYFSDDFWLKQLSWYGAYGVHVFFVISGLVIPYAMQQGGYRIRHFFSFLWKRIIRIEPPYLISVVLVIMLNFAGSFSPWYHGEAFHLDGMNVLAHIGYANAFVGAKWLNPVYWTLAIEFQYYLLIALIFGMLQSAQKWKWLSVLALFNVCTWLLPNPNFVFQYAAFFTAGILTYKYLSGILTRWEYGACLLISLTCMWHAEGVAGLVAGSVAIIFYFIPVVYPWAKFLGTISYSVYLLHVPIGARVITFSENFIHSVGGRLCMVLLAYAVTIMAAWLFYRWVEAPCKAWAKKVIYQSFGSNSVKPIATQS